MYLFKSSHSSYITVISLKATTLHNRWENNRLRIMTGVIWLLSLCNYNLQKGFTSDPVSYLTCNRQADLLLSRVSNSFSVSCVSESQHFVYRDYATWHMPRCEPNVPIGGNKFLNLNSITVVAKTESQSNCIALHLVVSSGLKGLQACVFGSNPQLSNVLLSLTEYTQAALKQSP